MLRPPYDVDWSELAPAPDAKPPANTRHRLRWILGIYALALAMVLSRAVQLELSDGENVRRAAAEPLEKTIALAAPRGRILARDGTVLAADRQAQALAMHFRYLQTPPDARWLRQAARARLTPAQRRDPRQLAAAQQRVRGELADLHRRLAALCHLTLDEWRNRAAAIERRVTNLAASVNRRRLERFQEQAPTPSDDGPLGVTAILAGLFAPPERLPPAEVVLAEQTAYHPVVVDLPAEVVRAIQDHPDAFPGVTIVHHARRTYPLGSLASGIVGHVGPSADDDAVVGRMGIEHSSETTLRGSPGGAIQFTDRRGKLLSSRTERAAAPGRDVVLTLDPDLQRFAEQLLDRFARRSSDRAEVAIAPAHGGAMLVMDVTSGEILTAASWPRFDPNGFATGDARAQAVLADPRQPLFDRATKMAIPPGSVFKPLTALALLEHRVVDPHSTFTCRGYLRDPDHLRCQIFRSQGVGHGDLTLADALAQSCNVYFFHHAARLGAEPLVNWARRFGFGQLPGAADLTHDSSLEMFAIGQGTLTATPLEVVRMYAAIANGGYLVAPRFTRDALERQPSSSARSASDLTDQTRIAGLDAASLAAVREGLLRVVNDPSGTAYDAVRIDGLSIAGKTGTAETGEDRPDHAWFAGYVPADAPRWAFVVALEHGGSGAAAAGSLAKSLIVRMQQLGYLPKPATATRPASPFPPGKG